MNEFQGKVTVWEERLSIPTYGIGEPDKNPMFFENRVYQGSSGKVYPFPVVDKILDKKEDRLWTAVFLENEYLKVMILPELGGRIQRALDKTDGYDFIYYNEVIKPALVGLTGPWISGGIEFNWPQHHRPTTYSPLDFILQENDDGSKTVSVHEIDRMYGTKGTASFTLYPGKAYIEVRARLFNRTPLDQTFLWWANPAMAANENTQAVFPPDVHAVADHGRRDISRFPIATGVYYKHDYGVGTDISRYRNIPVPTSYMACSSEYDFIGGYDWGRNAGILHVADHHISPGKKQWTWGCGDFGKAWDRNLTDENGPYIELMTGVYTDNQPDFSWMRPFGEKTFAQYFMPYKKLGYVKNASMEAALNLTVENGEAHVSVYATSHYENARVLLERRDGRVLLEQHCDISPVSVFEGSVSVEGIPESELTLSLFDATGRLMLDYSPSERTVEKVPSPAEAAKDPKDVMTVEELYLTGQHIEQYRHATYRAEDYYLEALRRDEGDSRANTAYAMLLLRRGCFEECEPYFRRAIERLTRRNANPRDTQAYCGLGLSLFSRGRYREAYDAFYKATWDDAHQETGFQYLSIIAARRRDWNAALDFVDRALVRNAHNIRARGLRVLLLRHLGRQEEALKQARENIALDPFDFLSRLELARQDEEERTAVARLMRDQAPSYIAVAVDCAEAGFYGEAVEVLKLCGSHSPLSACHAAYYATLAGDGETARAFLEKAAAAPVAGCFPNAPEDIAVLEWVMRENPSDARAPWLLGCLFYDRRRYARAQELWETSARLCSDFPTVWRCLALAYYNREKAPQKALEAMERAFALDPDDARVFLELDQLNKKLAISPEARLEKYRLNPGIFEKRDDLYTEYVTLLNLLGRHREAYDLIAAHKFHPWEGGEGKITTQYSVALTAMADDELRRGGYAEAERLLRQALVFPENLGEGKLEGAKDNDTYYRLGCACEGQGRKEEAVVFFERAAAGDEEPAGAMYYNDQPADMILYQGFAARCLRRENQARSRFYRLIDYGERHLFDDVKMDYFAVSLPDLQLFDDDPNLRNRIHCHFLIALGCFGLGDTARADREFATVLRLDPSHLKAVLHRKMCGEQK